MYVLLLALFVAAVVFGVLVLVTSRGEPPLADVAPDAADYSLPAGRPLSTTDIQQVRFALAFRGYRMSEVDDALDRIVGEIEARDLEIAQLRAAAAEVVAPAPVADAMPSWTPVEPVEQVATMPEPEPEPLQPAELEPVVPEPVAPPVPEPVAPPVPEPVAPPVPEPVAPPVPEPVAPPVPEPVAPPLPEPVPPPEPELAPRSEQLAHPTVADDAAASAFQQAARPVYDPHAVRPASRYTQPAQWLDVEGADDVEVTEPPAPGHDDAASSAAVTGATGSVPPAARPEPPPPADEDEDEDARDS